MAFNTMHYAAQWNLKKNILQTADVHCVGTHCLWHIEPVMVKPN